MVDLTDLLTWQAPVPPPLPSPSENTFHIFNDCWWAVTNGGCCLEWTVPTGITNIKFELVGGGGPGGSTGGDHDSGVGGQGGAYAVKTLSTTPGGGGWVQPPDVIVSAGQSGGSSFAATVAVENGKLTDFTITNGGTSYTETPCICFRGSTNHGVTNGNTNSFQHGQSGRVDTTISGGVITSMTMAPDFCSTAGSESVYLMCAGGTSQCSCCCSCHRNCRHGCTSYITGDGLNNFCAQGGEGGTTQVDMLSNCYTCYINGTQCTLGNFNGPWAHWQCSSDQYWGADYGFSGSPGGMMVNYGCCQENFSWAGSPRGPFSSGGIDAFTGGHSCHGGISCCQSHSSFPGGGGGGQQRNTSTGCVAVWGNSGLIKISYQ